MSALTQNPESLLGAQIKVVTTFGEEIEGELFCIDIAGSNTAVLCQRLENGNVNYKWTKTNIIREVTATAGPPGGAPEELPHVDIRSLDERIKATEETAAKDAAKLGVGVTSEAQEIFNALSKTMEAEWDGEDIKVMGVKISKPYDLNKNISGGSQAAMDRVRKVLQNEMSRKQGGKQGGGK